MKNIDSIKKSFKDINLLNQALTHRSWSNENTDKRGSNERMEFLGDAVLELVVTDHLYNSLPDKPEGFLTALRANIVNTRNLSKLARKLKISDHIFLSKGEYQSGKNSNSVLADTIEAIIGAIYLDKGLANAKEFISENLLSDLDKKLEEPLKDPKSRLQEIAQFKKIGAPKYKLLKIEGPEHSKKFTIEVSIKGNKLGIGTGKSKNEAEQQAASFALESKGLASE